jgi:phage-related protein
MAGTQAICYCDKRGGEHVDEFIEALPAKRAAKIDDHVEEHFNGRAPDAPPPEFPISSQIEGELRELRIRFANTRYRILYQRSGNLIVLLHAFEKNTGAVPASEKALASGGWLTSSGAWTRNRGNHRVQRARTRRRAAGKAP